MTISRFCLPLLFSVWAFSIMPCQADELVPIKPRGLHPGDTIMFVAPAGRIDPATVDLARQRLEEAGFKVIVPSDLTRVRGYLAGSDQRRANELMEAFRNPDVDAVFPFTGGYGVTRILDLLDYDMIAQNPKLLIGFSDITALHLAIGKKCNLITLHSPVPMYSFGQHYGLGKFRAKTFWACILAEKNQGEGVIEYEAPKPELPILSMRPGIASGRLVGGNLSLISALMGTPYEIETDGRVLFMEDVHESPYRIDRMLSQLKLAGKLEHPAAVVLGSYRKCEAEDEDEDKSLFLNEVFDDYFGEAPYPVIKNFPSGHGDWNATLPMGAMAEVNGDKATLRVLERPVVP